MIVNLKGTFKGYFMFELVISCTIIDKQNEHIQQKKKNKFRCCHFVKKNLFNFSTLLRHYFNFFSVGCNNENQLKVTLQFPAAVTNKP